MTELCVKWSCEYCTYENWPSAVKCTMCRAQRPSATIITEEPFLSGAGHQWDPVGNDSLLICPDSSARPRVRPAESSEHSGKWSCQVCTFLNWPRAIRCTQCRSVRQRLCSPTETPQTSRTRRGPAAGPPVDPCEEYNDRNRLNTRTQCWTCSACSYENCPKSSRCVVCDHPEENRLAVPQRLRRSIQTLRVCVSVVFWVSLMSRAHGTTSTDHFTTLQPPNKSTCLSLINNLMNCFLVHTCAAEKREALLMKTVCVSSLKT
uniref:RanBP2-type domain-containing protein n=1 Tax=Cyprinus carpio TaxID=7962 RepID=A0A8C1N160_CYPCA